MYKTYWLAIPKPWRKMADLSRRSRSELAGESRLRPALAGLWRGEGGGGGTRLSLAPQSGASLRDQVTFVT